MAWPFPTAGMTSLRTGHGCWSRCRNGWILGRGITVVLNWHEELKRLVPTAERNEFCEANVRGEAAAPQLAKLHENLGQRRENGPGAERRDRRTSGAVEAVELADPERAYLSE